MGRGAGGGGAPKASCMHVEQKPSKSSPMNTQEIPNLKVSNLHLSLLVLLRASFVF